MNDSLTTQEIKQRLDSLPPWPWKRNTIDDYIGWSVKALHDMSNRVNELEGALKSCTESAIHDHNRYDKYRTCLICNEATIEDGEDLHTPECPIGKAQAALKGETK